MGVALLVLFTLVGIAGVVIATAGGAVVERPVTAARTVLDHRLATAALVGGLVLLVSGWVVPAVVVGVAGWFAAGARTVGRRHDRSEIERIEALASWIENLRDVLVAGDQPIGAITSTVSTCPAPIRPQVRRLAAGLGRQEPDVVFRRFADEIDDPLGDLVAAGLLIAVRRGARTVAVLSALAAQARTQADRRRLVEAERAPTRREVATLTGIMAMLVVALLVFGRSEYLAAYDEPAGQLFMAVALVAYGSLLVRVQHLAHFPRPSRFLSLDGGDLR